MKFIDYIKELFKKNGCVELKEDIRKHNIIISGIKKELTKIEKERNIKIDMLIRKLNVNRICNSEE